MESSLSTTHPVLSSTTVLVHDGSGSEFKYDFYLLSGVSYFLRTFVFSAMNSSFLCKKSKISRDPLTGASSNLENDSPSVSEKEEV